MTTLIKKEIHYPSSDGKPMADNTLQFRWIVTIQGGLDAQYRDDANVFVAGDLLWYPVEGEPSICVAPDTLVVFGRPKGERKSYKQWEEANLAPQVVFEVLSDSNRPMDMLEKLDFYETHGVEEYYIYDPQAVKLFGWIRNGTSLRRVPQVKGWISPRLGIRFELGNELEIYGRDGRRFASYVEVVAQRDREQVRAEQEKQRAEQEKQRAEGYLSQLREKGIEPAK
jgi:Uma2 family endonuclease